MMVALLLYAYPRGIRSARAIERACDERATVRRLIDEINEFNADATGIRDFRERPTVETDSHGEPVAGVYGWSWGGTCWIDALWVREDMRWRRVGSRLLEE
jgi:GNAT superfamily N-acetyltransferase